MVQTQRIFCLLGAVLVFFTGLLSTHTHPDATTLSWGRFIIAGGLVGLLVASFTWRYIRRTHAAWMKGVLYVLMGWYALQVLQHGLGGARDTGLLVVRSSPWWRPSVQSPPVPSFAFWELAGW